MTAPPIPGQPAATDLSAEYSKIMDQAVAMEQLVPRLGYTSLLIFRDKEHFLSWMRLTDRWLPDVSQRSNLLTYLSPIMKDGADTNRFA